MKFAVISIFPEIFQSYFSCGVVGKAIQSNRVEVDYYNPRNYSESKHGIVDDRPFGGGAGMVLKPEPVVRAIDAAKNKLPNAKVVYLSPQGEVFNQVNAESLASDSGDKSLILLSGRYEGIDERVIENYVDFEISIGDYVLSGGELASLVVMDSIIRLLPGALGAEDSSSHDSFASGIDGILDYPNYTRPVEFEGHVVPEVLRSGNHSDISRWRRKQSLGRTWLRRPNLLKCVDLNATENKLLEEFKLEYLGSD